MIVLCVSIFATSLHGTVAIRDMPEGTFERESYLSFPTTATFEKVRGTMVSWMARLPAGPSQKGAGH